METRAASPTPQPPRLRVRTRWTGGDVVVSPEGDLNSSTAEVLREVLADLAGRASAIRLDLSSTTFAGQPALCPVVEADDWSAAVESLVVGGDGDLPRTVQRIRRRDRSADLPGSGRELAG